MESDSREYARLLREVASAFRDVDAADLTDDDCGELREAFASVRERIGQLPASAAENVHRLPVRPGPEATTRQLQLAFDAFAARVDAAAREVDRRLDDGDAEDGE